MLVAVFASLSATLVEIILLGLLIAIAAIVLGVLLDDVVSQLLFAILFFILLCLLGYITLGLIGFLFTRSSDMAIRAAKAQDWATTGLVITAIAATAFRIVFGRKTASSDSGKRRAVVLIPGLWTGFCFASWVGHAAGGWVGLLTITLPAVLVFWFALYLFAHFILPLDDDQPVKAAFRCLLTFSNGSNYPYYAIEEREKVERVPGNQFKQFFAGPGIFLTGPDHVVVVSSGLRFNGVRGPGVVFTKQFETTQEPMELRPQQRSYTVEAITKDGIPMKFTTFGPFQLDPGKQKPELGKPFPFRASSVFKAFHSQPVDIRRDKQDEEIIEKRVRRRWDELYEIVGTYVMQDIIAEYKFDDLCEPLDPKKDPRTDIAEEYRKRMRGELPKYGIRIPGGGVSNLLPADEDTVLKRRVMNWQAQWKRRMIEKLGESEADIERMIGETRAGVQVDMIQRISEAISEVGTGDDEVVFTTVALRFIDSLNQMLALPEIEERLPSDVAEVIHNLPHIIGK